MLQDRKPNQHQLILNQSELAAASPSSANAIPVDPEMDIAAAAKSNKTIGFI